MKALVAIPVMLVLTLVSVPFILVGLGYAFSGDEERYNVWIERSPAVWWLNRVYG